MHDFAQKFFNTILVVQLNYYWTCDINHSIFFDIVDVEGEGLQRGISLHVAQTPESKFTTQFSSTFYMRAV
jgi:hypothetical protein